MSLKGKVDRLLGASRALLLNGETVAELDAAIEAELARLEAAWPGQAEVVIREFAEEMGLSL